MKPYYNKSRCHAAPIRSFKITDITYRNVVIDADGFPKEPFIIYGGWNTVVYEAFPEKREEGIVYSIPGLWVVQRYDMSSDEMKYSVVEDSVFRANFYSDDDPLNLVEGVSFERPRAASAA